MTSEVLMREIRQRDFTKPLLQRDAMDYPFIFHCSEDGCHWKTSHRTEHSAHTTRVLHRLNNCPLQKQKGEFRVSRSIVEEMWENLDVLVKACREPGDRTPEQVDKFRQRAHGVAICIQIVLSGHYPTVNDVLKQAAKRYDHLAGGGEYELTPGIMPHHIETPLTTAEMEAAIKAGRAAREVAIDPKPIATPPKEKVPPLPPQKAAMVKQMLEGGFDDEQIAKISGIAARVVKLIREAG